MDAGSCKVPIPEVPVQKRWPKLDVLKERLQVLRSLQWHTEPN